MDDLISRAAAIAKVNEARKAARTLTGMDFVMMLEKQPAVDAAPVVRCGDCKMRSDGGYCPDTEMYVGERFFCAHGRRREANVAERAVAEMAGIRQDDYAEAGG